MTRIEFFPTDWRDAYGNIIDLGLVPDGPAPVSVGNVPPDAELRLAQERWLLWASEVVRWRKFRIAATEGLLPNTDMMEERALELVRCQRSPAYFIATWTHLFEFRQKERSNFPWYRKEMGGWLPFIPFEFQVRLIQWIHERTKSEGSAANGAVSKSRDMGVTDTCCRYALWSFLFENPSHVKFISRKSDLVDQMGNMDSILERISSHLLPGEHNSALPSWMLPDGFDGEEHRKLMFIKDPSSRNQISGEATSSKSGRGGRAGLIFVDEASFIEKLREVLTATQQTAPSVILVTSESARHGEAFIQYKDSLKMSYPDSVMELDYYLHPFHDDEWLEDQRERYGEDSSGFESEILRDPYASIGERMYPDADDITFLDENIGPGDFGNGYLVVGIDPGLADQTALHWLLYQLDGRSVLLESYEVRDRKPADYIAALIAGVDPEDHPELRFTQDAMELMEWVRSIREPDFVMGDPYGFREHKSTDDSWYETMYRFWAEHNPRKNPETGNPNVYPIRVNWKPEGQRYRGRRQSLMRRLRSMEFNDTPEVRKTVLALQRSRWEDSDNVRRATEPKTAKHDIYSHRRSALEYIAVNLDVIEGIDLSKELVASGSTI